VEKRFWLTTLAVVVAMGMVVTGATALVVTSGSDDEDAPGGVPEPGGPGLPELTGPGPLGLPDEPTWTTADFPAPGADGVALGGDVALAYGPAEARVIELRTGEERWALTASTDLSDGARWRVSAGSRPQLVGAGRDIAVLTEYRRPLDGGRVEDGLVLLSAPDGQVLWLAPLTGPHLPTDGRQATLRVADEQVATATVGEEVVAVDMRSGARLWAGASGVPAAIAGGTLLSVTDGRVTTADLLTGAPTWTPDYRRAEPVAAAGDVVAVHGDDELVVLAAATGQELVILGDPAEPHCVSDPASIACAGDGTVEVFDVWNGTVRKVEVDGRLEAILRDRIFLTSGDRHYTVDMNGDPVDDALPARPAVVADNQLVVTDGEVFSGYRVST
jgi:outer membrane protein assembly factor BamB